MRVMPRTGFRIATIIYALAAVAGCCTLSACAMDSAQRDEADSDAISRTRSQSLHRYGFRIGAEDFSHCVQALRDQRARSTSP